MEGWREGGERAPAVDAMQIGSGGSVFCLLHPVRGAQSHVWAFLIELAPRRPPSMLEFCPESGSPRRRQRERERDRRMDFKVSYFTFIFLPFSVCLFSSLNHFRRLSFFPPIYSLQ